MTRKKTALPNAELFHNLNPIVTRATGRHAASQREVIGECHCRRCPDNGRVHLGDDRPGNICEHAIETPRRVAVAVTYAITRPTDGFPSHDKCSRRVAIQAEDAE